jgi:anaerobic selenocysteine-containing dehydrogenase
VPSALESALFGTRLADRFFQIATGGDIAFLNGVLKHLIEQGWLDAAYNHAFCGHGFVFAVRGFGVRSAANGTKKANDCYFAVCFLGDDSAGRADVTPEARRALEQLIAEYRRRYPKAIEVRPHSDFVATECPGDELRALISRL